LIRLTQAGDSIIGLYNTTAGQSAGGYNGVFSSASEETQYAIDNDTTTKYLNFGNSYCGNFTVPPGICTGFIVTPSISNYTVARALLFATAGDAPERDPITVTLEGSNSTNNATLLQDSCWTLIYNGSTGISSSIDPGRSVYVMQQNFSNTMAFASYRLLVTSIRGSGDSVQYSEAQILGFV
jgi:hypothetical protein